MQVRDNLFIYNTDCMKALPKIPDNYFDLAICDPPYGLDAGSEGFMNGDSKVNRYLYKLSDWDTKPPPQEYFEQLLRVSKNQIIWGGNYFSYLWQFGGRCFIFWDKTIHGNTYADGELAWTSFDQVARVFVKNMVAITKDGRIHPTQKPQALYDWLYQHYAKPNFRVLDTHLGSGSNAISAYYFGIKQFVGYEIDKDYYSQAIERIKRETRQISLF